MRWILIFHSGALVGAAFLFVRRKQLHSLVNGLVIRLVYSLQQREREASFQKKKAVLSLTAICFISIFSYILFCGYTEVTGPKADYNTKLWQGSKPAIIPSSLPGSGKEKTKGKKDSN